MTEEEKQSEVIRYWMQKADEALTSADSEWKADRFAFSLNRAYYACFYAMSAALVQKGFHFSKHAGVRAALHQHFIKTGKLDVSLGRIYDWLFDNRQEGDYLPLVQFEAQQVKEAIKEATTFVTAIRTLLLSS